MKKNGWTILSKNVEKKDEGKFAYIVPRGNTIIDYAIVTKRGQHKINELKIEGRIKSEHHPLEVIFKKNRKRKTISSKDYYTHINWEEEGIQQFSKKVKQKLFRESNTEKAFEELMN